MWNIPLLSFQNLSLGAVSCGDAVSDAMPYNRKHTRPSARCPPPKPPLWKAGPRLNSYAPLPPTEVQEMKSNSERSPKQNGENKEEEPAPSALQNNALYEQASASCQNYSQLTGKGRTLAATVVIGFSVTVVAACAKLTDKELINKIVLLASCGLLCLTGILAIVTAHFSTAFWAMRNWLAEVEKNDASRQKTTIDLPGVMQTRESIEVHGPWSAHKEARSGGSERFSFWSPFVLMALVGGLGIFAALLQLLPGPDQQTPSKGWSITFSSTMLEESGVKSTETDGAATQPKDEEN